MTFITDWQFTFSVFSFFLFVAFRFNRLTGVVRSSLQNIQKAIKVIMFNLLLLRVLKIRRTGRLFSKSLSLSVIDSELSIKKCTPTGCCVRKCHGKPNSCCVTKLSYDHIHDTRALLEEINKWISFFFGIVAWTCYYLSHPGSCCDVIGTWGRIWKHDGGKGKIKTIFTLCRIAFASNRKP